MENLAGSSSHPNQAHEPGFDPNSWLTLGTGPQEKQAARQPHASLYCSRTFLSSQDLGGHQPSHGRKRKRGDYAAMFPPTHVPIIPMFEPIIRVEPPPGLELGQGLGEGAGRMNPVPPNGYPGLLERRLGLRVDVEKNLLGRMEIAEGEDGEDDIIEVSEMCIELKNMHGGHESGDGCERKEGVAEDISKEFDLTLRL